MEVGSHWMGVGLWVAVLAMLTCRVFTSAHGRGGGALFPPAGGAPQLQPS